MLKRHCKDHAEWRLQRGKPAERLPAHYRLDCDHATPIMICWEDGGSEPINLCESHAKALGRSGENCPGIHTDVSQLNHGNNLTRSDDRTSAREAVRAAPKGSVSSAVADSPADTKVGRATKDPSARFPARDVTFGNSAKALVDETIWNMATGDYEVFRAAIRQGKPVTEAAQAAGGQLPVVHRKISDYTGKLEAALSESRVTINAREAIDRPLEQALLEIISDVAMSDPEKDAAIQQLGALEEWVKHGLQGDITPLEANRIIRAIGDRLNWGGSSGVPEELKPAYRAIYSSLKGALRNAVPEVQNLHERLTNLYAAKSELETLLTTKELNPMAV